MIVMARHMARIKWAAYIHRQAVLGAFEGGGRREAGGGLSCMQDSPTACFLQLASCSLQDQHRPWS